MNEIVIRQSAAQTKLASNVHRNAAIKAIRLSSSELRSDLSSQRIRSPLTVSYKIDSKSIAPAEDELRFQVECSMTASEGKAEDATPQIVVRSSFLVDYHLREGAQLEEAEISAFAQGNAIFNVWPYFREYLQSTLQRMGLPPMAAPFLRVISEPTQGELNAKSKSSKSESKPKPVRRPARRI